MFDLERTITARGNDVLKILESMDSPIELLLDFEQDHVCVELELSPTRDDAFVAGGVVLRHLRLMCFTMTASRHMKASSIQGLMCSVTNWAVPSIQGIRL